jgi:hypothetical protein
MLKIFATILFSFIFLFLSGCSSKKLTIKSLHPSQIEKEKIYTIKVNTFLNDDLNQSLSLKEKIANRVIDGEKIFSLRNDYQVDAMINGEIVNSSLFVHTYYRSEIDYSRCRYYRYDDKRKTKECIEYRVRHIPCEERDYSVSTNIRLIKPSSNEILFTKTYNRSRSENMCFDYHYYPYHTISRDKYEINSFLANEISKDILDDISPHYEYWDVHIIEELDEKTLNFNDEQEKRFKKAVELLENRHLDIAKIEFEKLNTEFENKSFEVIYNLALISEAFNELENAKNLYIESKSLTTNLDYLDLVKFAINRTSINLEEKIKAKSQLP